jgi:hypothetical protein
MNLHIFMRANGSQALMFPARSASFKSFKALKPFKALESARRADTTFPRFGTFREFWCFEPSLRLY